MEEIKQELKLVNQRIDALDAKVDALDWKFEAKIDALDAKFEARFDALHRHFDVSVERIESVVKLLAEQMSDFNRSHRNLNGRVDTLEESQKLTDMRLALLEKR